MQLADFDDIKYRPPPRWLISLVAKPWQILCPVKHMGVENIPAHSRILFVGNHQNWLMDAIPFFAFLYFETGMYVRALIDNLHGKIPIHKHLLRYAGGIFGSPTNCSTAMESNIPLLVYPGGMIENFKDARIPKYSLLWKDRAGFARLAAKHNYTIVPFASVGFEDMFDMWFYIPCSLFLFVWGDNERAELEAKRYDAALKGTTFEEAPQVFSKGYIVFGKAIQSSGIDHENKDAVFELRDKVRGAVEGCISQALELQKRDPERFTTLEGVMKRVWNGKSKMKG
ncbi:hypothetical protein HDU98_010527 [Podochytrium sp. JEL0797]|nr:hypothetical protein HDU98_010527 [Podochytrium sp. JEL0797]